MIVERRLSVSLPAEFGHCDITPEVARWVTESGVVTGLAALTGPSRVRWLRNDSTGKHSRFPALACRGPRCDGAVTKPVPMFAVYDGW